MTKSTTITERISRMYRVIADSYRVTADVIRRDDQEASTVRRLDSEADRLNAKADSLSGKLVPPTTCDHEFDQPDLPCAYCGKTAEELGLRKDED